MGAMTVRDGNPTTRLIRRLSGIAILSMLVCGLFAIAYIHANTGLKQARAAAATARQASADALAASKVASAVASCVNAVLAERAPINSADQSAHKQLAHELTTFTTVEGKWADSLKALTQTRPGSTEQAQAAGRFIEISNEFDTATAVFKRAARTYQGQLDKDDLLKAKKPLGRC
jgi:hypothetical protein